MMRNGMMKKRIWLLLIVFVVMTPVVFGQSQPLEHRLTEAEKALMPAYLESLKGRPITALPPGPVRNIAEFEPMEGALVAWPLGIPVDLIQEMAKDAKVTTIVGNSGQESSARNKYRNAGVNMSNCNFIRTSSDSYWTRDYGPWFIASGDGQVGIIDFTYNRPRPNDNNIPNQVASFLNINAYFMNLVQCGGNYMTDGMGFSVSTDLVLEENDKKNKSDINGIVKKYLGVTDYETTKDPLGDYIKHVDCWGKYLDVDKILIGEVPSGHKQYAEYEKMAKYFGKKISAYGNTYQVFRVKSTNGQPYTNSLILNHKVLVPVTGSSADNAAIAAYQEAMPGYEVLGFQGDWKSTDALHCRVKGIADRDMVYIKHTPLFGEQSNKAFKITATIKPYSKSSLNTISLFYKINNGIFKRVEMTHVGGENYQGIIPSQKKGSDVSYYIRAEDVDGNRNQHPFIGEADPHSFTVTGGQTPEMPVAKISTDGVTGPVPFTVNFDGSSSFDPDGSIVSYEWNFGNGTTDKGANVQYTYKRPGSYTVTLTVTSNTGQTDDETITINAKDQNNPSENIFDGFETYGWKGGKGWKGAWTKKGDVRKISKKPFAGKKYARLRAKNGYLKRKFSLNGSQSPHLKFASRIKSFEQGDQAIVKVGPDVAGLKDMKVFTISDSDNTYHTYDIDLTEFSGHTQLIVVFDAEMNGKKDYWYLDNVEVILQ